MKPLVFVTPGEVELAAGCEPGSIGPVGLQIPVIADESAARLADFVCGANVDGKHLRNVNWGRDLPEPDIADLRNVVQGDPCPRCQGALEVRRGIEVGHIFQLGTKYSERMGATVLDEAGKAVVMPMGCYGIGVTRVIAAAIEQNHDEQGIIWPTAIAPFEVALVPIGLHKSADVAQAAEQSYRELVGAGFEVLFDDRALRPGVMFNDMELIGIPHRLVVGERGLDNGKLEYRHRASADNEPVSLENVVAEVLEKIRAA